LANDLPVKAWIPFSNMEATTLPFTPHSFMARLSLTATTFPGKSPGRECFVRGTTMASSMLVLGLAGGVGLAASCPNKGGRPRINPAPSSEPPPIFKKSRRSSLESSSIEQYPFFFISHLHVAGLLQDYSHSGFFRKIMIRPAKGHCFALLIYTSASCFLYICQICSLTFPDGCQLWIKTTLP